jgi:archaellum component FlaG (FlaF/FlaG flagellin family)
MAQDTINNAILIITAVIATTVVLNAVYPAMFEAIGSVKTAAADAGSRAGTSFTIVNHGFSGDYTQLNLWMKNTGKEKIADIDGINVYYGSDSGSLKRYHVSVTSVYSPDSSDAAWNPDETLAIGISDYPSGGALPHEPGTYLVKVVLTNGAESEATFNI